MHGRRTKLDYDMTGRTIKTFQTIIKLNVNPVVKEINTALLMCTYFITIN